MRRVLLSLLVFFGVGACAIPPSSPYSAVVNPPVASSPAHVVWGDSLAWQATNYPSTPDLTVQNREWHVRPGQGVHELRNDILNTISNHPAVLTIALGTNDAGTWDGRDGWTSQDEADWYAVLSARGTTKVVVVLPWVVTGIDVTAVDMANIERAREWFTTLYGIDGISFVDWKDYVSPGTLDAGGIHVSAGNEGLRYDATVVGDPL